MMWTLDVKKAQHVAIDFCTCLGYSSSKTYKLMQTAYRRCHEKTSYVSNYAFFTLLHKWIDRTKTHRLEKL